MKIRFDIPAQSDMAGAPAEARALADILTAIDGELTLSAKRVGDQVEVSLSGDITFRLAALVGRLVAAQRR